MTVIYPSPIFGPVHSRRLGVSLGINLLPADGKFCSFDCVYCECGFNADRRPTQKLPTREEVREALEARMQQMKAEGPAPEIMEDTLQLRDRYFPNAKVSVLTNATHIDRPEVHAALKRVDNNIVKLDTVDSDYIHAVDRPTGHYDLQKLIECMKSFDGHCIIQTMFMKGEFEGKSVDNTSDRYVLPWIEVVKKIMPSKVMIYTIDRETPGHDLRKATHEELDRIVALLKAENIDASASY
jgi:wyosine [tRNA(Phe)-imidazoG37] synthetase (radical SAM superfamily)